MTEKTYIIRATLEYEYKVQAENADDAAQMISDGENSVGPGQCVGYGIEAVVSADKAKASYYWDPDDDERAKCADCKHLLHDGHTGRRYYDRKKRTNMWPNACDEYGCGCLNGVEPIVAQPAAVTR